MRRGARRPTRRGILAVCTAAWAASAGALAACALPGGGPPVSARMPARIRVLYVSSPRLNAALERGARAATDRKSVV
jgi:hypothetical protein